MVPVDIRRISSPPSRGFGQRLRDNVREALHAAPADVALLSGRHLVGRVVNDAFRFHYHLGFRVFKLSAALVRSFLPAPQAAATAFAPAPIPIARTPLASTQSPAMTSVAAAPTVIAMPVEPPPPPARPRESWTPLVQTAAPLADDALQVRLDHVERFLDDEDGRLPSTTREEREQALETILKAVPTEQQDALWGTSRSLGECVQEMRFHATTQYLPNPDDPYGTKRLQRIPVHPPLVPLAEEFAGCLRLAAKRGPVTASDRHEASWVAHSVYREKAERKQPMRDLYARLGAFQSTDGWMRNLDALPESHRADALAYVLGCETTDRWKVESIVKNASSIAAADDLSQVLATVERFQRATPAVSWQHEWKTIAECRDRDAGESLDASAARYLTFATAVQAHSQIIGHGVDAYRAWWNGTRDRNPDLAQLAEALSGAFTNRYKVDEVARTATMLMREQFEEETLPQTAARVDGIADDALQALQAPVGGTTWAERKAIYGKLLETSTGWTSVAVERYQTVAAGRTEGQTLQQAMDAYLAIEARLKPLHMSQSDVNAAFLVLEKRGVGAESLLKMREALPEKLQESLSAIEEPLGRLGLDERLGVWFDVFEAVHSLSWNSETSWHETAATYRAAAQLALPADEAVARVRLICDGLKRRGSDNQRSKATPWDALTRIKCDAADPDFADHVAALRVLVGASELSSTRRSRAGYDDYEAVLANRFAGEPLSQAAERFTELARFANPTSGRFDVVGAFAAVAAIEGETPKARQQVLDDWLKGRSADYCGGLEEFKTAQRLRLANESLTDALARMKQIVDLSPVAAGIYERATRDGIGSYEERLDTLKALTAKRKPEAEGLKDYDLVSRLAGGVSLPQVRARFEGVATKFPAAADGREAFELLSDGDGYEARERQLFALLAERSPQQALDAFKDYRLLAECPLEGFDADRAHFEELRVLLPSTVSNGDVREAWRFVVQGTADGTFVSREAAQEALMSAYILRGSVPQARARALSDAAPKTAPQVHVGEERVKIGSVWVNRKAR